MSQIRTVNLELLRHGPAHNQLLSPLTRYLGLCGNHEPSTVSVPFEHEHFLGRLNSLRYRDSARTRQIQLKELAQQMSGILAGMPSLIAELSDAPSAGAALTHLQLVLSASELALLPFELANAPAGCPGAGQPLALQKQMPLCITRQVRRVSETSYEWPRRPRILFIAAAPPGAGPVPMEAHLQVLREAVDPWVRFYEAEDRQGRRAKLEPHLVLLLEASITSIEAVCRRESFSHVHILAHGVAIGDGAHKGFGLALHDSRDPARLDKVDGTRLAGALRTSQPNVGDRLSSPAVVSLASCDSGQVGSVVGAGASIAHALHEAGIPLVVASQFPLTFEGSVVMVRTLYRRLLEGHDPRSILNDLRQQLRIQVPASHDWASLVAYAALPSDLEFQLQEVRLDQAKRSIDAAIAWIQEGTIEQAKAMELEERALSSGQMPSQLLSEQDLQAIEARLERLQEGKQRLRRLHHDQSLKRPAQGEPEILGLLGSAEKREAQLLFQVSNLLGEEAFKLFRDRSLDALKRALANYRRGFEVDASSHWNLVQFLSLALVLDERADDLHDRWELARLMAERGLESDDQQQVAWAHGSLAELHVLKLGILLDGPNLKEEQNRALEHARKLLQFKGRYPFAVYSTQRQFERYLDWYFIAFRNPAIQAMAGAVEALSEELK